MVAERGFKRTTEPPLDPPLNLICIDRVVRLGLEKGYTRKPIESSPNSFISLVHIVDS